MKKVNKQTKKKQSPFKTPIKGILDILLIMTITVLAVVYLGPIVIGSSTNGQDTRESHINHSDYMCSETGRVFKDYLFDEYGEIYGWIDVEYHENGSFRQVTEHNERDNTIVKVFYSDENEFLYWIEIQNCEDGDIISKKLFGPDGREIGG